MPSFNELAPWIFGGGGIALVTAIFGGAGKFFSYKQERSASTALTQQSLIDGLKELHEKQEKWSEVQIEKLEGQVGDLETKVADLEAKNDAYRVAIHRLSDSSPPSLSLSGGTHETATN